MATTTDDDLRGVLHRDHNARAGCSEIHCSSWTLHHLRQIVKKKKKTVPLKVIRVPILTFPGMTQLARSPFLET